MKKSNFITLLATVIAMVGLTSAGFAAVAATKPVASTRGSVSLKPVKDQNGVFDVTVTATTQTQDAGAPLDPSTEDVSAENSAKKFTQSRVSNKSILEAALGGKDAAKGYKLQWVRPWGTTAGKFRAINREGRTVDITTSHLIVSWLGDANVSPAFNAFDRSIFKGVASLTASPAGGSAPYSYVVTPTASGDKKTGKIDGVTYYELTLFENTVSQIDLMGMGSFKDEVKGFSGKANLSGYGAGFTPTP